MKTNGNAVFKVKYNPFTKSVSRINNLQYIYIV